MRHFDNKVYIYLLSGDEILDEHKVSVEDPRPLREVIFDVVNKMSAEFPFYPELEIRVRPVYKESVLSF